MLISPPFLPPANNLNEAAWLNLAMEEPPVEGRYPVTQGLTWHGGCHLIAPANQFVVAIADGVVAYVRAATPRNQNPDDPQNYGADASVSGWTSDGCIVIRHDTSIGTGANLQVRFFSVYMHLEEVPVGIVTGHAIYRKDRLGRAGYINGQIGRIHCEIICDDANLANLVGRESGDIPVTSNGRSDAIFGEIYYVLPAGTRFFAVAPPTSHLPAPAQAPAPVYTSIDSIVVGIVYARDAQINSYRLDGTPIGTMPSEVDAEYLLFKTANEMHTTCSSAAYELLRFGRIVGDDPLAPANTPHWRKVCYPGGHGYVDLAPAAIHKFSDADFPQWKSWQLIDDSADQDSCMNGLTIRALLDIDQNGALTPEEVRTGLAMPTTRALLEKTICKIPTEWSSATIDLRWSWLKRVTPENPVALDDDDYARLRAHIDKLSFWE
jgi:hypothetical protein